VHFVGSGSTYQPLFFFFPVNLWKIYKAVETLGGYDAVGVLKQTNLSQPVAGLSPPISHSCHW